MADPDLIRTVWGETSGLAARDGAPAGTMSRLYAVVSKLAAAQRGGTAGQLRRADAPRADDAPAVAAYTAIRSVADSVAADTWRSDVALPLRAVLWETSERGDPLRERPLPPASQWMLDPAAAHGGDYVIGQDADRRFFRLYESDKPPGDGEPLYVSAYTGSGAPRAVTAGPWYRSPAWWIGLGGGTAFLLAVFSLLWTATSFAQAYDLLEGAQPAQAEQFAALLKLPDCTDPDAGALCFSTGAALKEGAAPKTGPALESALLVRQQEIAAMGPDCNAALVAWGAPNSPPPPPDKRESDRRRDLACLALLGQAVDFASGALVIPNDGWIGAVLQKVGQWVLGWHVPHANLPSVSLDLPLALMMFGVIAILVGLGLGVEGKPLGALISPEGRYSLALSQVTFWTVLVLTSLVAISVFNAGLISEHLRSLAPADSAKISVFPEIPNEIWAVLGITFSSPVLSDIIKRLKPTVEDQSRAPGVTGAREISADRSAVTFISDRLTSRIVRSDSSRASIADWFLGEETANLDKIDISRVQMVLVSAGLLVTYGNELFASGRDLAPASILHAVATPSSLITILPPVGATMAVLLAVSHATYIIAKAAPKTGQ